MKHFIERQGCPACRSQGVREVYAEPMTAPLVRNYLELFYRDQGGIEFDYLENVVFALMECRDCGLIFQKYVPDDFLSQKLYAQWIDPKRIFKTDVLDKTTADYAAMSGEIISLLSLLGKPLSKVKVLDWGCGWGLWARCAKDLGCSVYGIELASDKSRYAESLGVEMISPEELARHRFDLINMDQFLEHVVSPRDILRSAVEILNQGGLLRASVPNGRCVLSFLPKMNWSLDPKFNKFINPVSPLEHVNCFQRRSLSRLGQEAGLALAGIPLPAVLRYQLLGMGLKRAVKFLINRLLGRGTDLVFAKI